MAFGLSLRVTWQSSRSPANLQLEVRHRLPRCSGVPGWAEMTSPAGQWYLCEERSSIGCKGEMHICVKIKVLKTNQYRAKTGKKCAEEVHINREEGELPLPEQSRVSGTFTGSQYNIEAGASWPSCKSHICHVLAVGS